MDQWEFWLDRSLWLNVGIVAAATIIIYIVIRSLLTALAKRLAALSEKRQSRWLRMFSEILGHTSRFLLMAFSLLLGLKLISLPLTWESALSHSWFVILALQVALWADAFVRVWTQEVILGKGSTYNPVTTTILSIMALIVVWSIMLLSILANLGVDITALVASLGVGGIAVALAVQTMLSDIFASLSIGIDKPFEIGDFIVFGDVAGSIEHIGLKTTRIRALSGEQVIISNADLLHQTVHNYKRMATRRIVFRFGITYNTPVDKVRRTGEVVKEIISAMPQAKFDRAHFCAFDDSQLTFEVVYIMQVSDYTAYMDTQQEINLSLMQQLQDMGVSFAFPTRSIEFVGGEFPPVKVDSEVLGERQENPAQPNA